MTDKKTIHLRVDEVTKAKINNRAKQLKMTMSQYCEYAVHNQLKRDELISKINVASDDELADMTDKIDTESTME